ncbi:MAG TPA: PAS domain S-box protein, partial [Methanomicrobiales archaeon]|nr:PAS domain S-box protein [Methanomicrobiales archaeon]
MFSREALLRALIDNSSDAICVKDTRSRWLMANPAVLRIIGRSAAEALGKTDLELYADPKLGKAILENDRKVMEGKRPVRFEEFADTPDGRRLFSSMKAPLFDDKGNLVGLVGISRDITGQKRSEQALAESEEKYRSLVERAHEGIIVVQDSIVKFCNQRTADMWGGGCQEIVGRPFQDFIDPEDFPRIRENYERRMAGMEVPGRYDTRLLRKDGTSFPVDLDGGDLLFEGRPADLIMFRDITGRERAEKALRESEEMLRLVLDTALDGICRFNYKTGVFDYVSPSVGMILGYPMEELMNWDAAKVHATIHPDDLPATLAAIKAMEETGEATAEYREQRKDGTYVWLSNHMSLVRDNEGQPLYRNGCLRDITERKRAEEALRESEERFRLALSNAPVSVAVQDLDLRFIWAYNQRTHRADQIVGKVDADLFPPEDAARLAGWKRTVLETGEEVRHQLWLTSGGKRVYLDLYLEPIRDAAGRVTGVGIASVDLTERKRAEDALRERELYYQTVADNTFDWEFWLDPQGLFLYCSPSCEMITGHKPAEFMADPGLRWNIIHPDDRASFEKHQREVHEHQGKGWGQWRYLRPDGSVCWVEHVCQPVYGEKGEFLGIRGSNRDITLRKAAEEALRASEARFRGLYETMTEGLANHEVVYEEGKPVDYVISSVNPAFERITGLSRADSEGKKASELYGTGTPPFLDVYARVASGQGPEHFETYFPPMGKHFAISVFSPEKGKFATVFQDITDRKRAEDVLRGSEARFRALAEAMPQIVWSTDAAGSVEYCNPKGLEYAGLEPGDIAGFVWQSRIHPDDLQATIEWLHSVAAGQGSAFEYRVKRADGQYRWHMALTSPIRDEHGTILRWIGTSTDIHDMKATEAERERLLEAAQESERLIASNLEAMTRLQRLGGLFLEEGNLGPVLTEIVDAAIAISGADFGNIQLLDPATGTLRVMAHRGFPSWWLDYWARVPEGKGACGTAMGRGERVVVEDIRESPIFQGEALEVQSRAGVRAVQSTPLVSRSGKPLGMFSTHYREPHRPDDRALRLLDLLAREAADMIERHQAEEALRDSEERFRALAENVPDMISRFDPDLRLLYANPAVMKRTGLSSDSLTGRTAREYGTLPETNDLWER